MITIYKSDGTIRTTIHESADSYVNPKISDEEYAQLRFVKGYYIPFDTGDYVQLYGMYYSLLKKPATIRKNSSVHYEYTLKFESPRADCDNVDLQLFDNTTSITTPAYNSLTEYSKGDVVSYHTLYWECIYPTSINGISPEEGEYWQLKSNVTHVVATYSATTNYTAGDEVLYNDCIWKHIGVDTVGIHPEEGDHWTLLNTAPLWDFSSVLTPRRWAQLFCDNMNRARPNQNWSVGYTITDQPKEQAFSSSSVLSGLSDISNLYNTEFWIGQTSHNNYTINIGKRSNNTSIVMKVGSDNGFKNLERDEITQSKKITRLIAHGGTKNIRSSYRGGSKKLMLPDKYYLDADNIDLKNPLYGSADWDDIYPAMLHATDYYDSSIAYVIGDMVVYNNYSWTCILSCTGQTPQEGTYWQITEGTVTTAVGEYKLIDKNLSFNPRDPKLVMSDGTQPKVHFITGNLAGYEFPITSFDTSTKQITIGNIQDSNDSVLPTAGYTFAVGDQFNIVDFYMPDSYITKNENYLKAKAQEYLNQYCVDQVTYKGDVNTVWATDNQIELNIGDLIQIEDDDFNINLKYRIVDLKRYITEPYKYEIVLDNAPYVPTKIQSIINSTNQNKTYIQYNSLNNQMSKVRTYKGAAEALSMAFDPEGSYFTEGIAPLFVKSAMALIGTESQQYSINGIKVTTYSNTPNVVSWSAGTISDSTQQETERTWNIPSGSFTATDNNSSYYAYVRCNKTIGSSDAIILFSETQYKVNTDNDYYYFLLGTLTELSDSIRQFFTSKGFTFISGDTIVTGKVKSQNGNSYFDLDNDEMHFGDTEKYIEWKNNLLKIKGILSVSPSGSESAIGVFRGAYATNTLYYNGDTVTYGGSTWRYINTTPAKNIVPNEGSNWTKISAKGDTGSTGPQGVAGNNGADGVTTYTWIKYANDANGTGISNDPTDKSYIGFSYNKTTPTESNTASDYMWSLIKGAVGNTGATGATGADGVTHYTWIKYSDNADGTGLYDTPTSNTLYIGIAVNKTTATESTIKTDYVWSKFKGDTGPTGATGNTGSTGNYFEHRYAVNGSNTDAPSLVNTDTIPSGWTTTLPSMNLYQYMWITTAKKTSAGALVGTWSNPQRFSGVQGTQGAQGDTGPAMSFYGTWNASNIYIGNSLVVSVVLYNGTYYIARYDVGGSFSSSTTPNNDTAHWNSFGASFSSIATGLLLAQEAYINNLIVSRLATSTNPYRFLLSILDSSLGIFRNKADSVSIFSALIALGKDITTMQSTGQKKPALFVRDGQWRDNYSSSTIYYKDDRVYYSPNISSASTFNILTAYTSGSYVIYQNTVFRCTTSVGGIYPSYPYVDSYGNTQSNSYWTVDGYTYLFTHDWLSTETPYSGITPTNTSFWNVIGNGNLNGGKFTEAGCEGIFSNGSNINALSQALGIPSNFSSAHLLQKRLGDVSGISAALYGNDQTEDTDAVNASKSYGGWFNRLFMNSVLENIYNLEGSSVSLTLDKKSYHTIHSYATSSATIILPKANYRDIGLKFEIRKCGSGTVTVKTSVGQYLLLNTSPSTDTSMNLNSRDSAYYKWDGKYWVLYYNNN